MRVNAAIADGSFFENAALSRRVRPRAERGGDVHLLGLVSHGGVHSHIDHLPRAARARPRPGWRTTWIHAFTDGRDVSPTSAVDDLAELPAERIATVVGRYYAMDRDGRWERTERALDAIVGGRRAHVADDPVDGRASELRRGRHRRVHRAGRARRARRGSTPGRRGDLLQLPARPRRASSRSGCSTAGFDLTTMTRYRDDFDCPVAFAEQAVPRRSPRCSREHGAAPAPRGRDGEVRARDVLLQRRRRAGVGGGDAHPRPVARATSRATTASRRCRRARSRALLRRDRRRLPLRGRQLREPGHGRPHGLDPGRRRRRSRPSTRASAASSTRRTRPAASASSPPTTATPSRCSSRTASARTRRTRRTRCRSSLTSTEHVLEAAASSPTSPRPSSAARPRDPGRDDGRRADPTSITNPYVSLVYHPRLYFPPLVAATA